MLNLQPRTLNLTRSEVLDIRLVLALIAADSNKKPNCTRWSKLYEKVCEQFEAQEPEEYQRHKEA